MSNIFQALLLGLLQGCSEFLPISSSAHLILLPKLMHWQDFGLQFDITIHLGSLLAIVIYFINNKEFKKVLNNISLKKLFLLLIISTIPVGLCGLLFKHYIENYSRSLVLISATTMFFGILLGFSYYIYLNSINSSLNSRGLHKKFKLLGIKDFSIKFAILIGIAQAIAIIPGVSRSGITLTAGLLLGFNLLAATRISFLLAIPVILAAGFKQLLDLLFSNAVHIESLILLAGFFSSFISSLMFVAIFFKYIEKIGMWPFVIYRISLGFILWI